MFAIKSTNINTNSNNKKKKQQLRGLAS
jgi:hypothetical protein